MQRKHLLIVIGAALATFGLLLLPKAVVKKAGTQPQQATSNREGTGPAPATEASTGADSLHNRALPAEASARVAGFKKQLAGNPKATAVYDSLAAVFNKQARPDSAAVYLAAKADITKAAADQATAADAWAESAALALTPEKQKSYNTRARAYYEQALQARPADNDLRVRLAMTWVDSETPMQAITILRQVLQQEPDNRAAVYNMGLLSMRSSQFDKAVQRFERFTQLEPQDPKGWYYLGIALKEAGQNAKAKEAFTKLKTVSTDPQVQASADEYLKGLN